MARIPEAELARLKAEVSVARLVEGCGVELSRQGRDLVGRCPFHEDDSPSLVVSPGKNLWHCLGACQAGGGPVDWVMTAQGVSFRHAVELLRESSPSLGVLAEPKSPGAGPVVRSTTAKLPALVAPDAGDRVLLNEVVGFYAQALASHEAAQGLLARRRIDHPEAVQAFKVGVVDRTLGYRLPPSQVLAGRTLRTRLRDLGVLKANGREHFRGYLTFPVTDAAGDVGEVYGRRLDPAAQPRHLYLPGPHRGVWNLGAFASTDELVVTESVIDALTLWCAGFRHVTAAYGTGGWTTEHQQAVLEHDIARVLIAFDADTAGDAGAKTLAAELASVGVECFRVELPRGMDVNEVAVGAKNPTDALGRVLRKASWMGAGRRPPAARTRPAAPVVSLAASSPPDRQPVDEPEPEPVGWSGPVAPGLDSPAHEVEPVQPEPVAPRPVAPTASGQEPAAAGVVVGGELVVELGTRRWRVRGLDKVSGFDVLRVNVLVARTDHPDTAAGFHVDTLDLYSARARSEVRDCFRIIVSKVEFLGLNGGGLDGSEEVFPGVSSAVCARGDRLVADSGGCGP